MKRRNREVNVFSVSALDLFACALGAFILMSLIFMVFFTMTFQDVGQLEELQASLEQCGTERAQAQASLAQCEARLGQSVDASALAQCESDLAACEAQLSGAVDASELSQCQADLAAAQARNADLEAQLNAVGGVTDRLDRANEELDACLDALKRTFVLVIMSWSTNDDVDLHVVDPDGREFFYANRRERGSQAALEEDNIRGPGNEIWLHPAAEAGRYRVCYKLFSNNSWQSPSVRGTVLWQEGKAELPNLNLTQDDQVRLAAEILVDGEGNISVNRSRSGQVLGYRLCR